MQGGGGRQREDNAPSNGRLDCGQRPLLEPRRGHSDCAGCQGPWAQQLSGVTEESCGVFVLSTIVKWQFSACRAGTARWGGGVKCDPCLSVVHMGIMCTLSSVFPWPGGIRCPSVFSRLYLTLPNLAHSSLSNFFHWKNLTAHHLPLVLSYGVFPGLS